MSQKQRKLILPHVDGQGTESMMHQVDVDGERVIQIKFERGVRQVGTFFKNVQGCADEGNIIQGKRS